MARKLGEDFILNDGTTERTAYFKMPTSQQAMQLAMKLTNGEQGEAFELAIKNLVLIDPDTKMELDNISYDILDTIFPNPFIVANISQKFMEQITPLINSCKI